MLTRSGGGCGRTGLLERHARRVVHTLRAAQAHRLLAASAAVPGTVGAVIVMRRMRLRMVMMVMQLMVMAMVAGPTERRAAGHRGHAARSQRLVQLAAGGRVARAQRVAAAARVGRVVPAVADDAAADRIAGVVRLRRLLGGV